MIMIRPTFLVFYLLIAISSAGRLKGSKTARVNLGIAGNFAILSKTGVTTTGVTDVTGDMGVSPITFASMTGFSLVPAVKETEYSESTLVTGKIYAADYLPPTPDMLTTAVGDMLLAYDDAAGRSRNPTLNLGAAVSASTR